MTEVTDLKRPLDEQENLAPAKKSKPSHDGIAHIKPEFIKPINTFQDYENNDDDEGSNERLEDNGGKSKKFKKKKGQNKQREVSNFKEACQLCPKYKYGKITSIDGPCDFEDSCKYCHNIEEYLSSKLPEVDSSFFKTCPIFKQYGHCPMGVKCKFLSSHHTNNSLTFDPEVSIKNYDKNIINVLPPQNKVLLSKKNNFEYKDTDKIIQIQESFQQNKS